jgi:hypothetical protein
VNGRAVSVRGLKVPQRKCSRTLLSTRRRDAVDTSNCACNLSYLWAIGRLTRKWVGRLAELAQSFFRMVKERNLKALPAWLEAARSTALAGFARRPPTRHRCRARGSQTAMESGQVEGQVHRLKLIKRQMYERIVPVSKFFGSTFWLRSL